MSYSIDAPIPSDIPTYYIRDRCMHYYSDDERRIMAIERLTAQLKQQQAQRPITTSLGIKTVIEVLPGGRREERQEVIRDNCHNCHQRPAAITEQETNGQKFFTYKDHHLWWMKEEQRYLPRCDACAKRLDDEHHARIDRQGGYGGHR